MVEGWTLGVMKIGGWDFSGYVWVGIGFRWKTGLVWLGIGII